MELETFKLLADDTTRDIFKYIADNKTVQHKALIEFANEGVDKVIDDLCNASLVKTIPAEIKDFNNYIITAYGISVDRDLKELLGSYK